jgi:hypothetical protein
MSAVLVIISVGGVVAYIASMAGTMSAARRAPDGRPPASRPAPIGPRRGARDLECHVLDATVQVGIAAVSEDAPVWKVAVLEIQSTHEGDGSAP